MATKKWAKKEYEVKDHHQELTDKLIAKMEESKALNWEKPWFTCNELPPSSKVWKVMEDV